MYILTKNLCYSFFGDDSRRFCFIQLFCTSWSNCFKATFVLHNIFLIDIRYSYTYEFSLAYHILCESSPNFKELEVTFLSNTYDFHGCSQIIHVLWSVVLVMLIDSVKTNVLRFSRPFRFNLTTLTVSSGPKNAAFWKKLINFRKRIKTRMTHLEVITRSKQ